jgi:CheY-like chemotaxis protein
VDQWEQISTKATEEPPLVFVHKRNTETPELIKLIARISASQPGAKIILITDADDLTDLPQHVTTLVQALRCPILPTDLMALLAGDARISRTSARAPIRNTAACPARVLVCDDNEINFMVAQEMLAQQGVACDCAENGLQAVEAAMKQPYDIIFMDCQMPVMDGYTATEKIRAYEAKPPAGYNRAHRTTIIALTANALKEDRARCLAAGMDDYLAKPLAPEMINGVITTWMDTHGYATSDTPSSSLSETQNEPVLQVINLDLLLERCGRKQDFAERLIQKFSSQVETDVQELQRFLLAENFDKIMAIAHRIKGAAGNICAEQLHTTAAQLEDAIRAGNTDDVPRQIEVIAAEFLRFSKQCTKPAEVIATP